MNVGGGVPLSNRQNCTCACKNTTNTTRTDARRRVCGHGFEPLSHSRNVVTRTGLHTQDLLEQLSSVYLVAVRTGLLPLHIIENLYKITYLSIFTVCIYDKAPPLFAPLRFSASFLKESHSFQILSFKSGFHFRRLPLSGKAEKKQKLSSCLK